jgi:hypothetical protein
MCVGVVFCFVLFGNDSFQKHIIGGMLTSMFTDAPVVSSYVTVLINSCLYCLFLAEIHPLKVASLQSHMATDNVDLLYHRGIPMPDTLSYHRYLAEIPLECLECMEVYRAVHEIQFNVHWFLYSSSVSTIS